MPASIRDFVMGHPLFCHHNHHANFKDFDAGRSGYDHRSLLGYADADLVTAAGARPAEAADQESSLATFWPMIRTTGYGRAVTLCCQQLFGLDYAPENFAQITEALQASIKDKSASEVYDWFVKEKANTRWVLDDAMPGPGSLSSMAGDSYPPYYHFAWRLDSLFVMTEASPIEELEQATGISALTLDRLVEAVNANITCFRQQTRLAALKIGVAYFRDLVVGDPTRHEAEAAFNRIRSRKTFYQGHQQEGGAVSALEGRPLADYLFHRLMERANDENLPVQIHTGYLTGHWGSLNGTKAAHLIPIFDRYRRVRFDVFHASWPWQTELAAIAKNCPNVYPDLCWAWTMSPEGTERALSEWLESVPFNKIFGYGADTGYPWCDLGYALQARIGIARVLERKVEAGFFSRQTAEEVAEAVMLRNGEQFFGLPSEAGEVG